MAEYNIDYYETDVFIKRKSNCTILLGYTSNIVSSGVRKSIRFLVQHKMVNAIVFNTNSVVKNTKYSSKSHWIIPVKRKRHTRERNQPEWKSIGAKR